MTKTNSNTIPGERDAINNSAHLDTVLRNSLADPFMARMKAKREHAASTSPYFAERRAEMAADLCALMGRASLAIREDLHAPEFAVGIEVLCLEAAMAIGWARTAAEVAALFKPDTGAGTGGPFGCLSRWATRHTIALYKAEQPIST